MILSIEKAYYKSQILKTLLLSLISYDLILSKRLIKVYLVRRESSLGISLTALLGSALASLLYTTVIPVTKTREYIHADDVVLITLHKGPFTYGNHDH